MGTPSIATAATKSAKEATALLKLPTRKLVESANAIRRKFLGDKLELCSIINAKSGLCGEDCKFCAQSSRHHANVPTYSLKNVGEIIRAARKAKVIGAKKFGIVTSGNRLTENELKRINQAIARIRRDVKLSVCASLGALGKIELERLKESGLARYHHNIETSPRFYRRIVSTHSFKERTNTIAAAKEAGLEVCSGGIVGMGETWQDRIDMARLLKKLDVDSVPINFLVPVRGTPMQSVRPISCNDAVRTLALFRIILKDKLVKVAAGRESVLKDFQGLAFSAGANGMLIGGYLTVEGRPVKEDQKLIKEIKSLWKEF